VTVRGMFFFHKQRRNLCLLERAEGARRFLRSRVLQFSVESGLSIHPNVYISFVNVNVICIAPPTIHVKTDGA